MSLALDEICFVHVIATFFANFLLMSPKGPPSIFIYFVDEWMFKKLQRPFTFFEPIQLTGDSGKKSKKNFEKKFGFFFHFFPHAGT